MYTKTESVSEPVVTATTGRNHAFSNTERRGLPVAICVANEREDGRSRRRPRFGRIGHPDGFNLTERDVETILFIARIGCATRDAIQDLLFGRWGARATARLRGAFEHRYLNKLRGRAVNEPDVYYLSPSAKRGWAIAESTLAAEGRKPASLPHPRQLEETLMMARLFARLFRATKDADFTLIEWRSERELRALSSLSRVVPDGYLRVARGAGPEAIRASFLIELERSDRAIAYWEEKFRRYVDLYEWGSYEREFGTPSLRILIILDRSAAKGARLRALAGAAHRQEATMVRFSIWSALKECPPKDVLLGRLWAQPESQEPVALFEEEVC